MMVWGTGNRSEELTTGMIFFKEEGVKLNAKIFSFFPLLLAWAVQIFKKSFVAAHKLTAFPTHTPK